MAHRTELNIMIAELTGLSKHFIDRIGVNLNKGGIIQAGGRGRHAPDMEPEDLRTIILAILGSSSTSKVFQTVLNLHMYQSEDGQELGEVLLGICYDLDVASAVMQISVMRNYSQATIYWKDESGFKGVTEQEQPGLKILASMSGAVISELVKLVLTSVPEKVKTD
jgi:hypothetical protein